MTHISQNDDLTAVWDAYVMAALRRIPVCTSPEEKSEHLQKRRNEALHLAAAALRASGEHTLAENLLSETI